MFESLEPLPADAILKLIAEHDGDSRPDKVDLGVGIYRDEQGNTPIPTAVKKAERHLLDHQDTKAYLGSAGDLAFNAAMQAMTMGPGWDSSGRMCTIQATGGSGSLRIAAGLLLRARPDATVWVSEPTWNNHVPLLGGAGLKLQAYPYYDSSTHRLRFADLMDTLATVPTGDVVLFHACCHNPSGLDPTPQQWREIAAVVADRGLVPFIDMAYQGLATGIEEDRLPVELMSRDAEEMIVASSCSKNFALYRDRVGTLTLLAKNSDQLAIVRSQALQIVRTLYSVPPDHGAAVVAHILHDDALQGEWLEELEMMRERLKNVRGLLVDALRARAPDRDFSHITAAHGMFSFLGLSESQVERLKQKSGVYMVASSRINVAGITAANVDYLADAIVSVL
ncbi:MAG: amino acid aminotransferase [Pseudomonadota bacterium]